MKHDNDYAPAKQYPHKASGISGSSAGSSKVSTEHTTDENPNNGLSPNAGKAPKHKHSSY